MTYRIYYNREEDYPQRWSFDEGDVLTEVNVRGYRIHGCECCDNGEHPLTYKQWNDTQRKRRPIVWLTVNARRVVIRSGIAHFYPPRTK